MLKWTMGICVSSLVNCATYLADRYRDWRWDQDDSYADVADVVMTYKPEGTQVRSIHTAVIDKNVQEIRRIAEEKPEARWEVNSAGETALHLACKLGYVPVAMELLSVDCPADCCTDIGTPIHCVLEAVRKQYISNPSVAVTLIHELARHGCDVNAVSRGQKGALFVSAEYGNLPCMETLLDLGADVNLVESNSFTPLYISVVKGQLECVNQLISKRPEVDLDRKDMAGRTPLISALIMILHDLRYERLKNEVYDIDEVSQDKLILNRFNRMAVVEALLRAGADPNAIDNYGRSALNIGFTILEVDNIRVTVTSVVDNFYTHGQNGFSHLMSPNTCEAEEEFQGRMHLPESVYTPLVRLLVMAGGLLLTHEGKDYSNAPEWLQQLLEDSRRVWQDGVAQKPFKLIHQCCLAIRGHLGTVHRLSLVHTLPLPPRLREYVCVRYI